MTGAILFGIGSGITVLFLAVAYVLLRTGFTRTGTGQVDPTAGSQAKHEAVV